MTFWFKNTWQNAQAQAKDQDPYLRADQLYRDIIKARTFPEIQAAINDAAPIDYDANQQLVRAQLPPNNWLKVPRVPMVYLLKRSLNLQDSVRKEN